MSHPPSEPAGSSGVPDTSAGASADAAPVGKAAPASSAAPHAGESFWSVVLRRTRYVVAIVVAGVVFWTAGWACAAPPPAFAGVSLLAWAPAAGLVGAVLLTILLLGCIVLAMIITHPDAPHTSLYCALLGLGGLSIRGGGIFMLLDTHQLDHTLPAVFPRLALECLVWAIILIIAEAFTLALHARYFANTLWIGRSGVDPKFFPSRPGGPTLGGSIGGPTHAESSEDRKPLHAVLANAAAFAVTTLAAMILLALFLKSQEKGQVLFAAFLSFGLAALLANVLFPDSSNWPVWLAVPAAAAIGYLRAPTTLAYPGHAASAMSSALPIDYLAAGIPGAILGYYTALRLRFHSAAAEAEEHAG